MKICLPSSGIGPDSASGGERYSATLTQGLTNLGHDVHVLLARGKPVGARGVTLERLPWGRGLRAFVMPFLMAPAIWRCWRRHAPDLIVSHALGYTGPAALLAQRLLGVRAPLVAHWHHLEASRSPLWALEQWAARQADLLIVDSPFVAGQLAEHGIRPKRLEVIYPGAPDRTQPGAAVPAFKAGPFLVLALGSCVARKEPLAAVAAFAGALRQLDGVEAARWRFVWAGEGPLRPAALRAAARLGVGAHVQFPGRVSEDAKWGLLAAADLFLHCARLEGFPLAVLEAQALGVPVVARRAASLPDLVADGTTGLLAESDADLARDLAQLMRDAPLRMELGRRAAKRIDERGLRWSDTVRRVEAAYRSVL